jgi:hypothetical protein
MTNGSYICTGFQYSSFAEDGRDLNQYAAYAYDAVVAVAHALESYLATSNTTTLLAMQQAGTVVDLDRTTLKSFGVGLYQELLNVSFVGVSGPVGFSLGEDLLDEEQQVLMESWGRGDSTREEYSVYNYDSSQPESLKMVGWWGRGGTPSDDNPASFNVSSRFHMSGNLSLSVTNFSLSCQGDGTLCLKWFGDALPVCNTETDSCSAAPLQACVSTVAANPTNISSYDAEPLVTQGVGDTANALAASDPALRIGSARQQVCTPPCYID